MNMRRSLLTVLGSLALLLIWSSVMLPTTSASATRPEPEKGPSSTLDPLSDGPIAVDGVTLVRLRSPAVLAPMVPAAAIMSEDFKGAWPATGWVVSDRSSSDGGEYLWGKRDCHPHTGSFGGWSIGGGAQGGALPCSSNYPNNVDSWAEFGPFDLSNASAANEQYTPLQDNGNWRGTTSQIDDDGHNLPISYTVESNMVTFLHFRVRIETPFFICGYRVYDYNTHNITGNTISITGQAVDPIFGVTLTYTVTGTFNSNTSASGNLQATVSGYVCSGGSASPTWTADWQTGTTPIAPSNLTADAWSETLIQLEWQDNSDDETGFKIEQALAATGPFTQVATTGSPFYFVSDLNCNTTYYYRVRAYNAYGDSDYSNIANATTLPSCPPPPPSNLTALAVSPTQIGLAWQDNSTNETGFKIEQSLTGTGGWAQIATTPANVISHTVSGLNCGTTYYYRVLAYNAYGDSAPSNTANATTLPCPAPAAPSNLTALAVSPTQIGLEWQDNSTNETGFKIEQSLTGASGWTQIATTLANVISHTVSGLNCGTTYYYRVLAYNANGDSPYSNTANAATLACTTVFLPVVMKDWPPMVSQP